VERRWKVLIVVSVAVFMVSLDLFIVNIAFPAIRSNFDDASVASLSWVLTAYAIIFAAFLVPAGRLADRIGRKRAFLGGLVTFLIGSALCGLAPSVGTLVGARVIQALGGAFLMPTSLALLLPEFPPQERAAAIGVWAAVGGVAAAAGPPIGGLLVQASWRWVFLVNLPVGIVAAYFAVRTLRESRDDTPQPWPDLIGTILLTVSIGVLALGLVKAPDWGWTDARTIASLLASVVGLGVFLRRCARHPSPVVDLDMLRVRSFAMANLAAVMFGAAFAAMLLSSILFLTEVWHYHVLRAGFAVAPGPALAATFAFTSGRWANRIGQRYLVGLGCFLFALGMATRFSLGVEHHYLTRYLPSMVLSGVGVGLTLPSMSSAAAASLPPTRFATGSAVITMARQIGSVLGVAILVAILGTPAPDHLLATFRHAWVFMIIASLLGSVAGLAIGRVTQHQLPEHAAAPPVPIAENVLVGAAGT
jgi:EmrB/QacA subfamily drug resistance transporter